MMMKEKVGEVFSIAMDNPAIPGCTISKAVHDGANDIICFSLARNTDISAEIYPYHKLIIMAEGVIEIYGADGFRRNLHTSESIITLTDTPMGIRTAEGAVYTEVSIRRSDIMNEAIKAGEVFRLAEIVPYQDGKIVNMDVVHNDKMKFVMITYGLKGLAAYSKHANALMQDNEKIDAFLQRALAKTLDDSLTVDDLVALTLETGKFGVDGMALLDSANTGAYGNPEITEVNIGVRNNPCILISGHDLKDLEQLLEQTKGTGVDVYTHSEMLPAHYYPAFKKYDHFAGNYGNAWWKQKEEFETFNGPILMTTNCIVPPADSYKDRLWTTGAAGYPGCRHIEGEYGTVKDFSAIIEQAKTCAPPQEIETGSIIGGFAHEQVFALADKVVEAIKSGAIRKFVVMAGCDGRMKSREYYKEFAEKLPRDVVILTAGCAKYKYNKLALGDIGGIPRVLDAGQCNDSYSLALIALKLKEVFGLDDVNDLPIAFNIAWYEQKAVIVLLALLYLGVKNIHLGPTLPAFLSPNVAKVLVENFGIAGIGTVDEDLKLLVGETA